eukprot:7383526-Prymnesium_polylepis.1
MHARRSSAVWAGLGQGGQCGMRRSWRTTSASIMQGGREVQARPSETATLTCGACGGGLLFAPLNLLPDCARRVRKELPCAWHHVAKVGTMDSGSCNATLY